MKTVELNVRLELTNVVPYDRIDDIIKNVNKAIMIHDDNFGILSTESVFVKETEISVGKHFSNGFKSWMETHHEIVSAICEKLLDDKYAGLVLEINDTQGQRGLYIFAEELTDKFENQYKGMDWDMNDYNVHIDSFLEEELK